MIKFLKYCAGCILTAVFLFSAVCLEILIVPSGIFSSSYQATIQDKEKLLKKTNEPKIVFVSGSSGAFGLNASEIEKASGYKVVNLGLHAGFGFSFISEIAKSNINPGDIILLGYEYYWTTESAFTDLGTDLVMSGIDNKILMYRYVLPSQWKSIVGYMFSYAVQKNEYTDMDGVYSRYGFSADGNQMIAERIETFTPKPDDLSTVDYEISESSREYLIRFKEYVESKGASVFFVAAPYAAGSFKNPQDLLQLKQNEESEIGILYISDPMEYGFSDELMFDSMYHCNSKGEEVRTQLLIQDLKRNRLIQ